VGLPHILTASLAWPNNGRCQLRQPPCYDSGVRQGKADLMHPREDVKFMRAALGEAARAMKEEEVPVGAVVVYEGRILARAHNRSLHLYDPTAHAEILALRRAARKLGNYRLPGCSLYATIEPCAMCAGAIVQARLRCVVFGTEDPKAGAGGSVLAILNHPQLNHRVEVRRGVLKEECASMLREFFRHRRMKKPA
jgi:tRNA(adenine34) deaminase